MECFFLIQLLLIGLLVMVILLDMVLAAGVASPLAVTSPLAPRGSAVSTFRQNSHFQQL